MQMPRELPAAHFIAKVEEGMKQNGKPDASCKERDDSSVTVVLVPSEGEPSKGDPLVLLVTNIAVDGRRCNAVVVFLDEERGHVCVTATATGSIVAEFDMA